MGEGAAQRAASYSIKKCDGRGCCALRAAPSPRSGFEKKKKEPNERAPWERALRDWRDLEKTRALRATPWPRLGFEKKQKKTTFFSKSRQSDCRDLRKNEGAARSFKRVLIGHSHYVRFSSLCQSHETDRLIGKSECNEDFSLLNPDREEFVEALAPDRNVPASPVTLRARMSDFRSAMSVDAARMADVRGAQVRLPRLCEFSRALREAKRKGKMK
ncbi:hypothetical protein BSKO_12135 [Bryopsis sp. KO-2023]|nr:hypothetical protein BSKO_12135 [Bryopsis sp. KO-2023]